MKGFGGMISMELGDVAVARRFAESTRIFQLAESLGGVESLIGHPASMTHASVPLALRKKMGLSDSLVRLSCGIEDIDDLLGDLEQAFAASVTDSREPPPPQRPEGPGAVMSQVETSPLHAPYTPPTPSHQVSHP